MDFHEILGFLENLLGKFKFHWNLTRTTGILHENQNTFLIISRSLLLRLRNGLDNSCRENQNPHFISKNIFGYRAVCDVMWKDTVDSDRPQIIVKCMRLTCGISRLKREYRNTLRISNTYWKVVVCIYISIYTYSHETQQLYIISSDM